MLVVYLLSPFLLCWRCLVMPVLPLYTRKWHLIVMFKYVEVRPFGIFRRGVQVLLKRSWYHHGLIQGHRSKDRTRLGGFLVSLFHWEGMVLAWHKGWKAKHRRSSRACRVIKNMDLNQTNPVQVQTVTCRLCEHALNLSKDPFLYVQSRNRAVESLLAGGIMVDNTHYLV